MVLPEWTEPPHLEISYFDFVKWLIQQRIQRDVLIRNTRGMEIILCDRSPICPLVFALANLNTEDFQQLTREYVDYSFARGTYYHLIAQPKTIHERLVKRQDILWLGKSEEVTDRIKDTEIAYETIFKQENIRPVVLVTDDIPVPVLIDKFEQSIAKLIAK